MQVFTISFDAIRLWLQVHWFSIAVVIVVAWIALQFGSLFIEKLIRRAIRRSPFSQELLTPEDIKKRQDTSISMVTALWRAGVWVVAVLTVIRTADLFDT